MFIINDDNSIYANRGDIVFFSVTAEDNGVPYKFQPGDVVRVAIYGKKAAETCFMQKDFPVSEVTENVFVYLNEEDTKLEDIISKHKDYWYEVVLNPDTAPQTIVGYDEDGAKVFRLFPESAEINDDYEPSEEDFPVVDNELDMTSPRPVANSAIAKAVANILDTCERTNDAVAEKFVTPQMFGAIGDGVADDTEAIQRAISSGFEVELPEGKYRVTDSLNVDKCLRISGRGESVIDFTGETLFNVSAYYRNPFEARNIQIISNGNKVIKASNGGWGASFLFDNVLITGADDACVEFSGAFNVTMRGVIIEGNESSRGAIVKLGTSESVFSNLIYLESCVISANRNTNLIEVGNAISAKAVNCTLQGFNRAVTGTMTLVGCWFEDGVECVTSKYNGLLISPHFANVGSIMKPDVDNADLYPDVKKTSKVVYDNSDKSILERMFLTPVGAIESLYSAGYLNGVFTQDMIYEVGTNMALYNVPINKIWASSDTSWLGFKLDSFSNQHIGIFEVKVNYFRLTSGSVAQRSMWHGIIKDGEAIELDSYESREDYPSSIAYDCGNSYLTFGNANGGSSMGWIELNRLSY